jgi:uncharacterized membrane protein (UPF0182 family)
VIRGNLQVLPIADSMLYVQPLFLENPQAQIPELARVALVMGERTAFDRTLTGALGQLLGIEVPDAIASRPRRPRARTSSTTSRPSQPIPSSRPGSCSPRLSGHSPRPRTRYATATSRATSSTSRERAI